MGMHRLQARMIKHPGRPSNCRLKLTDRYSELNDAFKAPDIGELSRSRACSLTFSLDGSHRVLRERLNSLWRLV